MISQATHDVIPAVTKRQAGIQKCFFAFDFEPA